MDLVSDDTRCLGNLFMIVPCPICNKPVVRTVHTKYGHLAVCANHTNEDLEILSKSIGSLSASATTFRKGD